MNKRNHPCPCGSGKKFKKCCSVLEHRIPKPEKTPDPIEKDPDKYEKDRQRIARSMGRPAISLGFLAMTGTLTPLTRRRKK